MKQAVLVAGTWEYERPGEWITPESAFVAFLRTQDIEPLFGSRESLTETGPRPFTWSTGLGGVGFGDRDLQVWKAAGQNLYDWAAPPLCPEQAVPRDELVLITHSHGLQVALYALALGLKADLLVDIAGPVREDMMAVAHKACANVRRWVHVHSDASDRWQWFGELGDGGWKRWFTGNRIVRGHECATVNDSVPKVGHSELLRDPAQQHWWTERGWLKG